MMRNSALLLLMLFVSLGLTAQNNERQEYKSVMIIPFDPGMYFSDSDQDLSKHNQKSVKEIRTMFRYGLNINLNAQVLSEYQTRALLSDTAKGAADDLYRIYKSISYYQEKSMPLVSTEEEAEKSTKLGSKLKSLGKKDTDDDGQGTADVLKNVDNRKYMNVKIHNKEMLDYLHGKYGTDLFVFINQFNLATNYEHCLDRATNNFEREIAVHFSIFDRHGKQIAGDIAYVKFGSNTNDIMDIMKTNFPIVSDYVAKNMPGKSKMKVDGAKAEYEEDETEFLEMGAIE